MEGETCARLEQNGERVGGATEAYRNSEVETESLPSGQGLIE